MLNELYVSLERYVWLLVYLGPRKALLHFLRKFESLNKSVPVNIEIVPKFPKKLIKSIASHECTIAGNIVFEIHGSSVSLEECGWDDDSQDLLWRFKQHYFNDLSNPTIDRDLVAEVFQVWTHYQQSRSSSVAWHPYVVSRRLINIFRYMSFLEGELNGDKLAVNLVKEVCRSWLFLERNLEHTLGGNHLICNLSALICSAALLDHSHLNNRLDKAMIDLCVQLDIQVLDDGGHYELSPMYQAIVMGDLMDVANAASVINSHAARRLMSKITELLPRMLAWLSAMQIAGRHGRFNDVSDGDSPALEALLAYMHRLGIKIPRTFDLNKDPRVVLLPCSGYFTATSGLFDFILDHGNICPDDLPAHGHADSLSLEIAYDNHGCFVNSGVSTYWDLNRRSKERSSAYHNTAVIDGNSSSDVWGEFRVSRRAKSRLISYSDSKKIMVSAEASIPQIFPRSSRIHRRDVVVDQTSFDVIDRFSLNCKTACLHYICDPALRVIELDGQSIKLFHRSLNREFRFEVLVGIPSVDECTIGRSFGETITVERITVLAMNSLSHIRFLG